MRKDTLNYIVDLFALLVMLGMVGTGLLIKYQLPPGSRGGHGMTLWGLDRHEWGDVHFWLAVALAALLVLHVALHWTWVLVVTMRFGRREGETVRVPAAAKRNFIGLVFLLLIAALVGGFVWTANESVTHEAEERGGGRGHQVGLAHEVDEQAIATPERGGAQRGRRGGESAIHIRGSMTLGEVAAAAGVDLDALRGELGLPADTSADERLGPLRQRYGFEMSAVRTAVEALTAVE